MSRKQWFWVIGALILVIMSIPFWPVQAGSSVELNTTDRMSENIHFVTYVDDADWTAESSDHVLIGGVFTADTLTSGDTGPLRLDADRHLQVDIVAGPAGASALALETSVDGLEGGIGAAADAIATQGGVGSITAKLRLVTNQLNTIDSDTGQIKDATVGIRLLDRNEAVAATGEKLDLDLSDVDTVTGLTAGATYMVVSIDGVGLFGVASVGAGGVTTANVIWVVTAGNTVYITMPTAQTVLHYSALTEDVTAYISQVLN